MKHHLESQGKISVPFWMLDSKKKRVELLWHKSESSSLGIIIKETYLFSTVKLQLPKNIMERSGR